MRISRRCCSCRPRRRASSSSRRTWKSATDCRAEGGSMPASIEYLEGTEQQKTRAFSPAVVSEGGKTVWLAGQSAIADEDGASIAGDCAAQTRTIFASIEKILRRCG